MRSKHKVRFQPYRLHKSVGKWQYKTFYRKNEQTYSDKGVEVNIMFNILEIYFSDIRGGIHERGKWF